MTSSNDPETGHHPLQQGDLRLLEDPRAKELLSSRIPARCAYLAVDGAPRVIPTWFHWTGSELVMPTFISAPHVQRPAARLRDLAAHPRVAVTIDTEDFPPHALNLRGDVTITRVPGVAPEYAAAAARYLGDGTRDYLAFLHDPITVMARIALHPRWVSLIDFETRNPGGLGGVTG